MKFANKAKFSREASRRGGQVITSEPCAEGERWRTLQDRKGEVVKWGVSSMGGKVNHWRITRSLYGRSDQFDVVFGDRIVFTGGKRIIRSKWSWMKI